MTLEERLKIYKEGNRDVVSADSRVERTIQASKRAFYESGQERMASYPEFLFQQAVYIRKRWWCFQLLTLLFLWWILYYSEESFYVIRSMGVLAPVFVILVIPEFWKNRSSGSMEVEGAAYYSLRRIYAARMLLFAMVDGILLSLFCLAVSATVQVTAGEMMVQFFLPFNVTCCICFGTLCGRKAESEYLAVGLSLLFITVWVLIVQNEAVYTAITGPVWAFMLVFSILCMAGIIYRVLRSCRDYQEVNPIWN